EYYHPTGFSWLIFLRKKAATGDRSCAKHGKKVRRHDASLQMHRLAASGENDVLIMIRGDVLEDVVLIAQIEEVRIRIRTTDNSARLVLFENGHQCFRILIRQRPQQDRIHHTENGSVG